MLTESEMQELLKFNASTPVLSLYLNTDPSEGNADAYRLRLRNMLKEVNLPEDTKRVEQFFFTEYDWSGKSVAVFSCVEQGFFKSYTLSIAVPNQIRVSDNLHFKPLADIYDSYGGYGVVLVDKQGARTFYFNLGQLEEQQGIVGEEVKHVKRGGASSIPGRRGGSSGQIGHEDEIVDRNMKDAVEFAGHFFEAKHVRRVVIGGTEENVSFFLSLLPKTWQSLVVGTFNLPITSSQNEVHQKAMQICREAEEKREEKLVDTAITAAAKGSGGAVGLEKTLAAVSESRVMNLLFNDGFFSQGTRCPNCGFITAHKLDTCPVCNEKAQPVLDIVDYAVRSVLKSGGDVDVLHQNAVLTKNGNIAAILRY